MAESSNSTKKCFNFIQTVFSFITRFSDSIKHLGQQKRTSSPQTRPLYSTSSTAAFPPSPPPRERVILPSFYHRWKPFSRPKVTNFQSSCQRCRCCCWVHVIQYVVLHRCCCTHSDSNKLINTYTESVWSSFVVWPS